MEASCGVETVQRLRESETKLQQQLQESVKRENILNMKLATKHQEMQDLLVGNDTWAIFMVLQGHIQATYDNVKCACRNGILPYFNFHTRGTWPFSLHNLTPCGFNTFSCVSMTTHVTAHDVVWLYEDIAQKSSTPRINLPPVAKRGGSHIIYVHTYVCHVQHAHHNVGQGITLSTCSVHHCTVVLPIWPTLCVSI